MDYVESCIKDANGSNKCKHVRIESRSRVNQSPFYYEDIKFNRLNWVTCLDCRTTVSVSLIEE